MKTTGLLLLLCLLPSCSEDATLAGVWSGSTSSGWALSFAMVETDEGVISGNGTLVLGTSTLPLPVNVIGSHAHPAVSLTIDAARLNFAPVSFQGALRADLGSIKGILNNQTLFFRDSITLTRTATTFAPRILAP